MSSPQVFGIIETGIYVSDTHASSEFYARVVGATLMSLSDRLAAMSIGMAHVLLLFRRGGSVEPTVLPGGVIPPNDGSGQSHFAFSIAEEDVEWWQEWLASQGVTVESTVNWDRGGKSLYFRDPDGNNVELATPGIWPVY